LKEKRKVYSAKKIALFWRDASWIDGSFIGFSKSRHGGIPPRCFQRLGHFAPMSFAAYGGKIQATRFAGGR
jgi:hypothetical protein